MGHRRPRRHADDAVASRAAAGACWRRRWPPSRSRCWSVLVAPAAAAARASGRPAVGGSPLLAYATGRAAAAPAARDAQPRRARGVPAVARARRGGSSTISSTPDGSLADPRQHPGEPPRAGRAPHVADQHRAAAALDAGGVRLRLHHARRPARPAGSRRSRRCSRMQRYRGHFYNWYDTRTLEPLAPRYISTVDSGNLAGYLRHAARRAARHRRTRRRSSDASCSTGIDDASRWSRRSSRRAAALPSGRRDGRGERSGRSWRMLRAELGGRAPRTTAAWTGASASRARERISAVERAAARARGTARSRRGASSQPPARLGDAGRDWLEQAARAWSAERMRDRRAAGIAAAELAERAERLAASRRRPGRGNRVRVPVRPRAAAVLDRLQRHRRPARRLVLRHAGLRGAAGQLPGHRHRQDSARALVQARAIADAERRIARAALVERVDVRVPDAAARDARPIRARCCTRPTTRSCSGRSSTASGAGCRGGSRSRPTTPRISTATTSTAPSAFPASASSADSADDLVVAPYASLLAAPLAPADGARQSRAASRRRPRGQVRLLRGHRLHTRTTAGRTTSAASPLPTYMAHHQGMSLVALDNVLNDSPMQRRFHADPRVQAAELLLQERIPHLVPLKNPPIEQAEHVPATRRLPRRWCAATSRRTRSARARTSCRTARTP